MRRRGREAEVWQHEEEERREALLVPRGRAGKEGGMKEEKCTSSCFFFAFFPLAESESRIWLVDLVG